MGIRHDEVKATGIRGYASEWNAAHVIRANVDFRHYAAENLIIENRTDWPAGPAEGQVIYRTDQHTFYHWNGTRWVSMVGPATVVVAADGSGETADIQEGIDMLPAAGGVVYIKEGTYNISSAISITSSNVTLFGAGAATIIHIINASNCSGIEIGDGVNPYSNITVSDLKIEGNSANQTVNNFGVVLNPNVGAITDSRVERVWVDDFKWYGFAIGANSDRNVIYACKASNCTRDGYIVAGSVQGNIISNNISNDNTRYGIVTIVGNNIIESNGCYDNGDSGIHVEFNSNIVVSNHCTGNGHYGVIVWTATYKNIISNNYCDDNLWGGIAIFGGYNTVTGNICIENRFQGIWIGAGDHNTITGNLCMNNSQQLAANGDGILLSDTATYNSVTANSCCDDQGGGATQGWGISEDAGVDNFNVILGNICRGNVTGGINVSGANTDSAHNQV